MPRPAANPNDPKLWGKVNKQYLVTLINEGKIDIMDISPKKIEAVWCNYFANCDSKIFRCNFHAFSSSYNLERKQSGARWQGTNDELGKLFTFDCHIEIDL
jgi:hypothetical protein